MDPVARALGEVRTRIVARQAVGVGAVEHREPHRLVQPAGGGDGELGVDREPRGQLEAGRFDEGFQGFGAARSGGDGELRFRSIKPVPYPGRTPHIHVKVRLGTRELLTTQLYVEGDPGNARDFLWRSLDEHGRRALTQAFSASADGLQAAYTLIVAA